MRISDNSIQKLQVLLKQQNGLECDTERAQAAGRAILRLVGIKLYQQFEKEVKDEQRKRSCIPASN
jgi:hypothetical protein